MQIGFDGAGISIKLFFIVGCGRCNFNKISQQPATDKRQTAVASCFDIYFFKNLTATLQKSCSGRGNAVPVYGCDDPKV